MMHLICNLNFRLSRKSPLKRLMKRRLGFREEEKRILLIQKQNEIVL